MNGNRRETAAATRTVAVEEPAYLSVGTEVSAKYRGAFCEASIKSVKKIVKCKVTYHKDGGSTTVTDEYIIGTLKVGGDVVVRQPDSQQDIPGTLVKITDSSAYTVVFDDGDERTLKRSSLCIKGAKHFNESETLDHLPLTDPENFGTPVVQQGKKPRKGRRQSLSNDGDEIPVKKKLMQNDESIDKVVMVDITEKKKTLRLPALMVSSASSKYGELKSPDNVLVRSFKDGKYLEVQLKDVREFSKDSSISPSFPKGESAPLKLAVSHAVKYLESKQLPSNWHETQDKKGQSEDSVSSGSSAGEDEDHDSKEKEEFMTKLYKFLEKNKTPLVRLPVLGHRDLDLYKLYNIVSQMGGMDKVTTWQDVYLKMDIPVVTTTASYHIKNAYKKCLLDYERHQQKLEEKKTEGKKGGKNEKATKKGNITTPSKQKENVSSKCDSESELETVESSKRAKGSRAKTKTEKTRTTSSSKTVKSPSSPKLSPSSPPCSPTSLTGSLGSTGYPSPWELSESHHELRSKANDIVTDNNAEKENNICVDAEDIVSDVNNSKEDNNMTTDNLISDTGKPKSSSRNNGRYLKVAVGHLDIKQEMKKESAVAKSNDSGRKENVKKENERKDVKKVVKTKEDDKKEEDMENEEVEKDEAKQEEMEEKVDEKPEVVDVVNSPDGTSNGSVDEDDVDEVDVDKKEGDVDMCELGGSAAGGGDLKYKLNDRIDVRYGRGRNATVYQAKITSVDPNADESLYYLVHYAGWNARHDEWIGHQRIIGKSQKLTRTRTKIPPKPAPKPCAKQPPVAKKNGKNGVTTTPLSASKGRKRTPSPNPAPVPSKNGGRNGKSRGGGGSDTLDLAEDYLVDVKPLYPRVTRQNSSSTPVRGTPGALFGDTKLEPGLEIEKIPIETKDSEVDDKTSSPSPPRASPAGAPRSESSSDENDPTDVKPDHSSMEVDESLSPSNEVVDECLEEKHPVESSPHKPNPHSPGELDCQEEVSSPRKRSHESKDNESDDDEEERGSPPVKKKHEDDVINDVVFDEENEKLPQSPAPMISASPEAEPRDLEPEATHAEVGNTPDLTCTEDMSTNCVSPDPYIEYGDDYYDNGGELIEESGSKEKDSSASSSMEETKYESNRKKGRRKARAPSSQSSMDGEGSTDGTRTAYVVSPTWTPKYNFTEGLEELLKKEESSERIRLLQEKIKDIRKVYGELKSEVANIDRKRKRRQKRKREEELSTEEGSARSPSHSSPLSTSTSNNVGSSTNLAPVECR